MDTDQQGLSPAADTPEAAMLDEVHRRLVQIHAAIAERTNQEVGEMAGWTLHELMALIREVGALRRERRGVSETVSRQDA